jgi:hypothetical protein
MTTNYKDKYLKYKLKYLNLQKGGSKEEIEKKIIHKEIYCLDEGKHFEQHTGECWNDSIQMLICFSDKIKQQVQEKLLNLTPQEIIDLAYYNNRGRYLAPIYRRSETDEEQQNRAKKFEKRLCKYLYLLQKRLCIHINIEKEIPECKDLENTESCPLIGTYEKYVVSSETTEKRRREITGIGSAVKGLKLINKKKIGANAFEIITIINIISFALLDEHMNLLSEYTLPKDFYNSGIYMGAFVYTHEHLTVFYICNGNLIYYNDNYGKINFNWKKLFIIFNYYRMTHKLIMYWTNDGKFTLIFKKITSNKCIIFDNECEIVKNDDIVNYSEWQKFIVEYFICIKERKLDLKNDTINFVLNVEFSLASIYNNSLEYIHSLRKKFVCEVNMNNIIVNELLDKIDVSKIINKIYLSEINNENKNKLIKKIFDKQIFNDEDYKAIVKMLDIKDYIDIEKEYINIISKENLDKSAFNIIKLFIDHGLNINNIDSLKIIFKNNNMDLFKFLIENGIDVNSFYNKNLLDFILKFEPEQYVKILLENKAIVNIESFEYILKYKNINLILKCIENGFDINSNIDKNNSVLTYTAKNIKNAEDLCITKLLIEKGADINYVNPVSQNILFILLDDKKNINKYKIELIKYLLEKGIDLTQTKYNDYDIVEYVNKFYGNNEELVKLFNK